MAFSTATTRTLHFTRAKIGPPRTVGVGIGRHHLRHVSNNGNNTPNATEQRYVSVAKRYASHHHFGFDLNAGIRNPSRDKAPAPPVDLQPILMESQMILHHLQQQHASFLHQNAFTCLQIHRDGTFALSSRIRGWKIWSHQDNKKKQQWLLVHTAGIFSQYLIPNKSDLQRTRIESKVDMFVRRLGRFGK